MLLLQLVVLIVGQLVVAEEFSIKIQENKENAVKYFQEVEIISLSYNKFDVTGLNELEDFGYAIFQVHAFHFNLTLSQEPLLNRSNNENGTNLGFVMFEDQVMHVWNNNFDKVKCVIVVTVYGNNAPLAGGCSFESPLPIKPTLDVFVNDNFVVVISPLARLPPFNRTIGLNFKEKLSCGDNSTKPLFYETYYRYLPQNDFSAKDYFEGIRMMIFRNESVGKLHKSKQTLNPIKRIYDKSPGTGVIFLTKVYDQDGNEAFYAPLSTYSCRPGTWGKHCSEFGILGRILAILLILMSVAHMMNIIRPRMIEGIINGAMCGGFMTIVVLEKINAGFSSFEIILCVILGAILTGAFVGFIGAYIPQVGAILTRFIVANILVSYFFETFFSNYSSTSLQLIFSILLSLGLAWINITFSVILGGFLLVLGYSYLAKGNIHRALINHIHSLLYSYSLGTTPSSTIWTPLKYNPINYYVELTCFDYFLLGCFIVSATFGTMIKHKYLERYPDGQQGLFGSMESDGDINNESNRKRRRMYYDSIKNNDYRIISRHRRRHHYRSNVINDRSPLISRWTSEGDDEVFESPESNSRFIRQLSSDSKERLSVIQQI